MERARLLPRLLRRLTIAVVLFTSRAHAHEGRVVVIDVDPRVAEALVVALSPWSLTVVQTLGPTPGADVDAASARARAIASDLHAGAVVWIVLPRQEAPATLWVYDAETLQLAVRPLTVWAPFDDAGAAAVALSVKTVLRASPLLAPEPAPAPERPPPPPAPATVVVATPPPPAPPQRAWRLETIVGVRAPTGTSAEVEARAALGASVWPAAFGGHGGAGLEIQVGPGVSVGTPVFRGELREASFEATARLRAQAGRWFAFEAEGGPGFLLASLDGQVSPTAVHVHAFRLDPAIDVGGVVDLTPGPRVSLGAIVDGSALLRFQRYALDGAPLVDGPAIIVLAGIRLSVEVD
jgi:hypothetical protein